MGRSLIDAASYDPDTLKMLSQAFDDVWREMAGKYHAQTMIEDRRNRLATIILGLADGGERDLALMAPARAGLGPRGEGPGGLRWLAVPMQRDARNDRVIAVGFAFLVGDLLPNMLSTFVSHQIIGMITHDHK